jgi:hypothetical protein
MGGPAGQAAPRRRRPAAPAARGMQIGRAAPGGPPKKPWGPATGPPHVQHRIRRPFLSCVRVRRGGVGQGGWVGGVVVRGRGWRG